MYVSPAGTTVGAIRVMCKRFRPYVNELFSSFSSCSACAWQHGYLRYYKVKMKLDSHDGALLALVLQFQHGWSPVIMVHGI